MVIHQGENEKRTKADQVPGQVSVSDSAATEKRALSKDSCADNDASPSPPDWNEIYQDATELESLLFCIRRPTSRDRLFKFVNNLKQLSGKLKRHEEVTSQLSQNTSSGIIAGKRIRNENGNDGSNQNIDDDSDQPQAKKPRAIPLETCSSNPAVGKGTTNGINLNDDASTNKNNSNDDTSSTQNIKLEFPKSFDPMTKPPTLKSRDKWVQHHMKGSNQHCPDFDASNSCPLGSKCNHIHIFAPRKPHLAQANENKMMTTLIYTKEDVDSVYETHRNISLTKTDYAEKIKTDELNNPNYSCSVTCPIDRTIYYAQPFPWDAFVKANKNHQGIWWYRSMKDARDAVATQIICDLQERGIVPKDYKPRELTINGDRDAGKRSAVYKASQLARKAITSGGLIKEKNTAPPILPDITPWNWMESGYEKRCSEFNNPQGCTFGCTCQYAHVHFHTELNKEFPDKEALPRAYNENFQMTLQDSFFQGATIRSANSPFRVMTAVDNRGGLWYTAALKCPREGIIYYAAGGRTGMLNKQNMVLYPSVEDAKLAVAGIVLESFKKRGMIVSENMATTTNNKSASANLKMNSHIPTLAVQAQHQSTSYNVGPKVAPAPPPPPRRVTSIQNQHQQQNFHQPPHVHNRSQYTTVVPMQQTYQHTHPNPVTATPLVSQQITQRHFQHLPQVQVQTIQHQPQIQPQFSTVPAFQIQPMQMASSSLPPPPPPPPPPVRTYDYGR
jgi:hypothetical protein